MRKNNTWKKVVTIAMATVIVGNTNMEGLKECMKVYANEKGATDGIYTIDEVQWNVRENKTTGKVELQLSNPLTVEGKDIVVPTVVEGIKIDVLSDCAEIQAKSITIPDGVEVGKGALSGCSVDTLYYKGEICREECVPENCKNIVFDGTRNISLGTGAASVESITCKNTPGVYFESKAVANAKNLKSLVIEDSINRAQFGSHAFASCIALEQLELHSKSVVLYQASFANCVKLRDVIFDGYAIFHASQYSCDGDGTAIVNQGGAFYNCFQKEYDSDGKLIKKTLTFLDGMCAIVDESASDCRTRVVENCSGLTDVIIKKEADIYAKECFYNCENLSNITFDGQTMLSSSVFGKLPALKTLRFYGQVEGETRASVPFSGCTAQMLVFYDSVRQMTISGMENLNTIYFGGKHVGLSELNQGTWQRNVILEHCDCLESIILDLDPEALNTWNKNGRLDGLINLEDNLTRPHNIYGFNYNNTVQNYIEYWTKEHSTGTFVNMIEKVETYFDGKMLGEQFTAKDIDTSKIVVKATVTYKAAQCLKQIGYDKYSFDPSGGELTVPLSEGIENTGYEIAQLPDTLVEGDNVYQVMYSGILASGTIRMENKTAIGLKVDWNASVIEELVENQPVTAADVASGATIFYDNGTTEDVDSSELLLNTNTFSKGENLISVSLKENPTVSEEKTVLVKENEIVQIVAVYQVDKTLYVGDTIDVNRIKLTPVYKYDKDPALNRQIDFTNISSRVLSKEGENILQVYYEDLVADLTIYATEVVPVKVYASFDSGKYSYMDGQEIDPKSVAVTVEYNNGARKSGEDIAYGYTVNEKLRTKEYMMATVTYCGVESESFSIPIMPKEVSYIKVTSSILSATEGTKIVPTAITGIEVFYNNGKSQVLDESAIDYGSLLFSDYEILADTANQITVTYLGKSDTITIFGISNTITGIYAEYKGNGVKVGDTLTAEDVDVYAINSNGRITEITQGILLENATLYIVGENIVTIHYGSLSCNITVTGVPMETNEPGEITGKKETETTASQNGDVVVSTPDLAGSVVTVSPSTIKLQANVKGIQWSENITYKVYTNKTVKIMLLSENADNMRYQLVKKNGKVQDDQWVAVNNQTITVKKTKKPSVLYFNYTDAGGVTKTVHTNGFFIDKTKATVNVKAGKTYKKGYKLTFKDVSGIQSVTLDGKKVKTGVKVKKKGSHTLLVTDQAGNKKKVKFHIK